MEYIYIYIHTYTHTHIYIHIHTYIHTHIINETIYINLYVPIPIRVLWTVWLYIGFITILRKFKNLLQKFGGWEREEELILEFHVYTASSKDKWNTEKHWWGLGERRILYKCPRLLITILRPTPGFWYPEFHSQTLCSF